MTIEIAPMKHLSALGRRLAPILRDRRGVAAVEFAFIAPLLLAMYLVTMEVAQGIEANKKVGRVGSMVADLITQQQETVRTDLQAIMNIGSSILQPYNRSQPDIVATAIQITDEETPRARVVWTARLANGSFSSSQPNNQLTTVPETLRIRDTFLVRVESKLHYRPVITYTAGQKQTLGLTAAFDNIDMQETYYLRPRMSREIRCTNC